MSSKPKSRASEQHKKFVEKAREIGCDEDEDAFLKALGKVLSAPPPKSVQKRKTKKPAK